MRKLVLLGVGLVLASGCGRGWLPCFRGAACNSGICGAPAMPASYDSNCAGCGSAASGYGDYEGEAISNEGYSSEGYYGGGVIQGGVIDNGYTNQGTIVSPSMTAVPPAN